MSEAFAAIDLGAESGRVVCGPPRRRARGARRGPPLRQPAGAAAGRRALEPARPLHRGARGPLAAPAGSARHRRRARGASTTRCSTASTACSGCRSTTATTAPTAWSPARTRACSRDELYATCGIQTMPINTVFQLLADEGTAGAGGGRAHRARARPLNLWLTGELANEITNASTTGLLDARSGTWARELIARLGLPAAPFARDPVEPGRDARTQHDGVPVPPGGQPRHRVGVRRRAAARRARGDPVVGDVVAARARAARAGARRAGERVQPHQRARRRRDDPAAAQRDGPVARAGVPAGLGRRRTTTSCIVWPRTPTRTSRCSTRTPTLPGARRHAARRSSTRAAAQDPPEHARRDRALGARLAGVQVPPGARAPEAGDRPRGRRRARHRRRRPQRAAVRPHRRRPRPAGARRPGRGDRARQRARPGARGRRGRLAGGDARAQPPPPSSRPSTSRATADRTPTNASSP